MNVKEPLTADPSHTLSMSAPMNGHDSRKRGAEAVTANRFSSLDDQDISRQRYGHHSNHSSAQSSPTQPQQSPRPSANGERSIVLQYADGSHLAGNLDVEDYIEHFRNKIKEVVNKYNLTENRSNDALMNECECHVRTVVHGPNTGVLVEFEPTASLGR